MLNKIRKEFATEGLFGTMFLFTGIITQVIAFYFSNAHWLSLISGVAGIFAVVLCAQRKISQYVFAWIQLITYVILAYEQKLYGEIVENMFYAATMIAGMYLWSKNYNEKYSEVKSKSLSSEKQNDVFVLTMFLSGCLSYYLLNYTDDTQPIMDAISTIPAFVAQILLILRYKEQWLYWLIIDVASIFMWINADDWCMVMQYVFWTINCLYGYYKWSRL